MTTLSDPVSILLIGSVTGLLGLLCKLTYSSKCKIVTCGTCLRIERDVSNEQAVSIGNASPRNISTV